LSAGLISLPGDHEEYEAGTVCTVTGWGNTQEDGEPSNILQKVPTQYLYHPRSSRKYEIIAAAIIRSALERRQAFHAGILQLIIELTEFFQKVREMEGSI
jgi:hypothetical protein